ncbi:hypothetical protein ACFPRL_10185 [Pseudoclavibacter helvolus]
MARGHRLRRFPHGSHDRRHLLQLHELCGLRGMERRRLRKLRQPVPG